MASIEDWRSNGMGGGPQLDQADLYGALLDQLRSSAPGDLNRRDLWEPVLRIGAVQIAGAAPAAIVAPWHPMRMAATAVKVRAVCGLVDHLLLTATTPTLRYLITYRRAGRIGECPRAFSDRRGRHEALVPGLEPFGKGVEDAAS